LQGIDYLHERKILHRDIKCQNLFLMADNKVKIGDFGVSVKMLTLGKRKAESVAGTPLFLSPEQVQGQRYDFKADIWQVGTAIYNLVCLEPPFTADTIQNLNTQIVSRKPKQIPLVYSVRLREFIDLMLSKNAN
jgi:serine/threonine protein kinase